MFSSLKVDIRWSLLLLLFSLLLLYIGLHPNPVPFGGLNERQWLGVAGDHWLHFSAFLLLTLLVPKCVELSDGWIFMGMVIMAVGSEMLQGACPWRKFDYYDIVANFCGIVAASIIKAGCCSPRREHYPIEDIV
jgi:glycopeptide antibiotics resistance protein